MAQASADKLEHTGPAEKERVASVPLREQLASMPELFLPKGKGTESCDQNTRSKVVECQCERESGIRVGAWRGKGVLHSEGMQVPRRKGRASKASFPRRSRSMSR